MHSEELHHHFPSSDRYDVENHVQNGQITVEILQNSIELISIVTEIMNMTIRINNYNYTNVKRFRNI